MLDLVDGAQPVPVDSVNLGGCGYAVTVRNGYAYVTTPADLVVVDVHNLGALAVLGRATLGFPATDIALLDSHAVITGSGVVELWDIRNPQQPARAQHLGITDYATAVEVVGADVYMATRHRLIIYHFDSPSGAAGGSAPRGPEFHLAAAFPNPFNAQTVISYEVPRAMEIELAVFDVTGRRVATLAEGVQAAGMHRAVWNATDAASGTYFARLQTATAVETRRLLLLK